MEIRPADLSDASAIAGLHADSWRFAYRGAFTDDYLDQTAAEDRLAFWQDKLQSPQPNQQVLVLFDDTVLIGFTSDYTDHHPEFGSFLNNLHVAKEHLRKGYGARLMSAARDCCRLRASSSPVYLLVLESNIRAQAFYSRLGGTFRHSYPWTPPGGGTLVLKQFVWPSPDDIKSDPT